MPRLARSSARCGPTPLIMRTSVERLRVIDTSLYHSQERQTAASGARGRAEGVERQQKVEPRQPVKKAAAGLPHSERRSYDLGAPPVFVSIAFKGVKGISKCFRINTYR